MAADDQFILKHAYNQDINGDAFDMECRSWKAHGYDEQSPATTLATTLVANVVGFGYWVLSKHLFHSVLLTISVTTLPLLKDFTAPWKESKYFFELPWQIPGLVYWPLSLSTVISG